jgi:hypothetical protein
MTAYNKEHEFKTASAQTGLFDLEGNNDFGRLEFNLEQAEPMTFEERLRGEKESI